MNELLQKHGCSNVFSVPEGLKELMADISREVLRAQPTKIFDFISNYLSALIITREHGIMAMKILDDLCDCKPTVTEHLMQLGIEKEQAEILAQVIKEEIEDFQRTEGKEKVKESQIIKKILNRSVLDEDTTARVCQVARNAYRDYWYKKKLLEQNMKVQPEEPWEIAAQRTLELYKKTKPSFSELTRATEKIQAAYRGYYVRKNLLNHLKPKPKKTKPKVDMLGPPADVAESREIDLGPVIDIQIREDDVTAMFDEHAGKNLGLHYDPMKTITHVDDENFLTNQTEIKSKILHQIPIISTKSLTAADTKSKQTSVEDVEDILQLRLPSQPEASRQSRQMSQMVDADRPSRIASSLHELAVQEPSLHKISFVEAPPEVIPDMEPNTILDEAESESEAREVLSNEEQEVQDAFGFEALAPEPVYFDDIEVPEDMADDRTEGDGASIPTASVLSSHPDTADNTDVEDAGDLEIIGDEEEGD